MANLMFGELERSISCFPMFERVENGIYLKINLCLRLGEAAKFRQTLRDVFHAISTSGKIARHGRQRNLHTIHIRVMGL